MKKYLTLVLLLVAGIFSSCKEDDSKRVAEQQRYQEKRSQVLTNISRAWKFRKMQLSPRSQELVQDWAQWRLFFSELNNTPTGTIEAFQKKSKDLTRKADDLFQTLPEGVQIVELRSRFLVLLNYFRSLEMFVSLDEIPEQKVMLLIQEINQQLSSIELQMEEMHRKKDIKMEAGEAEMLRLLDTSRAVKEIPKNVRDGE
jgi:hypothetical protein